MDKKQVGKLAAGTWVLAVGVILWPRALQAQEALIVPVHVWSDPPGATVYFVPQSLFDESFLSDPGRLDRYRVNEGPTVARPDSTVTGQYELAFVVIFNLDDGRREILRNVRVVYGQANVVGVRFPDLDVGGWVLCDTGTMARVSNLLTEHFANPETFPSYVRSHQAELGEASLTSCLERLTAVALREAYAQQRVLDSLPAEHRYLFGADEELSLYVYLSSLRRSVEGILAGDEGFYYDSQLYGSTNTMMGVVKQFAESDPVLYSELNTLLPQIWETSWDVALSALAAPIPTEIRVWSDPSGAQVYFVPKHLFDDSFLSDPLKLARYEAQEGPAGTRESPMTTTKRELRYVVIFRLGDGRLRVLPSVEIVYGRENRVGVRFPNGPSEP